MAGSRKLSFILAIFVLSILMMSNKVYCKDNRNLLTDPILMNPGDNSVYVVWFTEFEGNDNHVVLYENGSNEITRKIPANTYKLSRIRGGKDKSNCSDQGISIPIYRHQAYVCGLQEYHGHKSERVKYSVSSDEAASEIYTLSAKPQPGTPLKVLFTSDFQLKDMCAANIEKAFETEGSIDAVFADGDLADVADRMYDWFYADNAFFRIFQGRASYKLNGKLYKGAAILQNAPIYTSIGNHDVMGVYTSDKPLDYQFNNPTTKEWAGKLFRALYKDQTANESNDEYVKFITDNSYNTITVNEIFSLPKSEEGNENFYSVTFGDIRLVTLELARVWRLPQVGVMGKYSEMPGAIEALYGYGDFIFESIKPGSRQYKFLREELAKKEYSDAKYRVVMAHNPCHSLGGNQIPAFTDPVSKTVTDPVTGQKMVLYEYPKEEDYINRFVIPQLNSHNTDLFFIGHTHVWNRFRLEDGMNILETSNVGNSYGGYYKGSGSRYGIPSVLSEPNDPRSKLADEFDTDDYPSEGDLFGCTPEFPTEGKVNEPFFSSNTKTVFSVFNTETGLMNSYYYDTEEPDSESVLFDSFSVQSTNHYRSMP